MHQLHFPLPPFSETNKLSLTEKVKEKGYMLLCSLFSSPTTQIQLHKSKQFEITSLLGYGKQLLKITGSDISQGGVRFSPREEQKWMSRGSPQVRHQFCLIYKQLRLWYVLRLHCKTATFCLQRQQTATVYQCACTSRHSDAEKIKNSNAHTQKKQAVNSQLLLTRNSLTFPWIIRFENDY